MLATKVGTRNAYKIEPHRTFERMRCALLLPVLFTGELLRSLREQRVVLLRGVQAEVDVAEVFVGADLADAVDERSDLEL